jgi:putative addiction module component (TIGR02574 family)
MAMMLQEIKEAAIKLTPIERVELMDYLAELPGTDLDDAAWQAEIRRRVAEIESGVAIGVPLEDVFRYRKSV